jgi:hypothetical protein
MIALMMEAASMSETSANFYQITRRNNPEDSRLHTPRRENLILYKVSSQIHFLPSFTGLYILAVETKSLDPHPRDYLRRQIFCPLALFSCFI